MAQKFDPQEVLDWLEAQIVATQIDWMDHYKSGNGEMQRQQEAILDGIYLFRQRFFDIPTPAPGQGYEPDPARWTAVEKERSVRALNAQIDELTLQRDRILQGQPRLGTASLAALGAMIAQVDE